MSVESEVEFLWKKALETAEVSRGGLPPPVWNSLRPARMRFWRISPRAWPTAASSSPLSAATRKHSLRRRDAAPSPFWQRNPEAYDFLVTSLRKDNDIAAQGARRRGIGTGEGGMSCGRAGGRGSAAAPHDFKAIGCLDRADAPCAAAPCDRGMAAHRVPRKARVARGTRARCSC